MYKINSCCKLSTIAKNKKNNKSIEKKRKNNETIRNDPNKWNEIE